MDNVPFTSRQNYLYHKVTLNVDIDYLLKDTQTIYLGMMIDENVDWEEQLKRIRSKINTDPMSLKRLKDFLLPQRQLCCAYYGLVESNL